MQEIEVELKNLKVLQVAPERLIPANYNPRRMTEKQVEELKASMVKFGLVEPLVANANPERQHHLIGGHQRLAIAKLLGWTSVPVVYVSLDEAQERELNLRLNKNLGEWDWDALAGFDISSLIDVGFDEEDLKKRFGLDDEKQDTTPQMGGMEYRVVISCRDESHQREVLAKLESEGLQCVALIV
jgi:ParB-like chromosome segregation protein Spo0J